MPRPSLPPTPAGPPSAWLSRTWHPRSVRFGAPKGEAPPFKMPPPRPLTPPPPAARGAPVLHSGGGGGERRRRDRGGAGGGPNPAFPALGPGAPGAAVAAESLFVRNPVVADVPRLARVINTPRPPSRLPAA